MKRFSKNQIREIAADVFGRYPRANNIAVTDDGQAFIIDNGDTAVRNHARVNRYKEQLEITFFKRAEFEEKQDEKSKNNSQKVAPVPKVVKPAAKKPVPAKKDAKGENPEKQNESEQPKKEEQ